MKNQEYTVSIIVNATTHEAYTAINNVSKWWTENLEGNSQKLNDEFTVRFGDVHMSTQKIVETIPGEKVEWLVTASQLNFIKNKQEWNNTKIRFDIIEQGDKTKIRFTHIGLVPEVECYDACSNAWGPYIQQSLFSLITTGKGKPTPKESKANAV